MEGVSLFQQLINGLTLGAVYALIAVGYTMVYGIIELINFAHGEVYMMVAFIACKLYNSLGIPFMWAICASILLTSFLGVTIEFIAYRPLRNSPRLVALISAIGVSLFLQNLAMIIWGARRQPMVTSEKAISFFEQTVSLKIPLVGEAIFTTVQIIMLLTAVFLMIGLSVLIKYTKMGRAMRACAQNRMAAKLMGVSVNGTISATFAIGSAMGAVAGILVGLYYNQVYPMMGYMAGIKAFTGSGAGRNWQYSRSFSGGDSFGGSGGIVRRLYLQSVDGCAGICNTHSGAYL